MSKFDSLHSSMIQGMVNVYNIVVIVHSHVDSACEQLLKPPVLRSPFLRTISSSASGSGHAFSPYYTMSFGPV
jgi:hypothetical protein